MQKQYLECGKIVSVFGIDGEVKLQPWCDINDLKKVKKLYLNKNGENPINILLCRFHKEMVLLKIEGINNPDTAANFRNKIVYINRNDIKLKKGQYFISDLIGMKVFDVDTNEEYGKISDVFDTGANTVYSITFSDGKERLIPAIKDVVIEIDTENEIMKIRPLKGLFDDED